MYSVSSSVNVSFSHYMAGYLLDRPHILQTFYILQVSTFDKCVVCTVYSHWPFINCFKLLLITVILKNACPSIFRVNNAKDETVI